MFPMCSADIQARTNIAERSVTTHSRHPIEHSVMTLSQGPGDCGFTEEENRVSWLALAGWQGLSRCLAKQNHRQLSLIVPEARF